MVVTLRFASFFLVAALLVSAPARAGTLDEVRTRDLLICGVSQGLPGFSAHDAAGKWSGIDVDVCRALAAAVLKDSEKVRYVELSPKERFTALQSGEVDVLSRNTTWTLVRDTALGLNFAGVDYYDGQGFMVRKELGLKSATELSGARVCVAIGTTTELNLADYFRAHGMEYRTVNFENQTFAAAAYDAGQCDAFTADMSALASYRTTLKDPSAHVILPEVISKEPLGPVVRHGDDQWFDLVKWALFAMLQAEESGVTKANLEEMKKSSNPMVRRLLGVTGNMGRSLGLDDQWAVRIIVQVGNYGEVFDRNIGAKSPLKLPRGLNALWKDGGLQYPMPVR